jgi:hypothetical protein
MDTNSRGNGNEPAAWHSETNVNSGQTPCVACTEPLGASSSPISNLRDVVATYWTRLLERVKTRSEAADKDIQPMRGTIGE